MDVKIAPDWKELLAPEFEKPYFVALTDFVRQVHWKHVTQLYNLWFPESFSPHIKQLL